MIKLEELTLEELMDMAEQRGHVDRVQRQTNGYRIEIGAGVFLLDRSGARLFLERIVREHNRDVE